MADKTPEKVAFVWLLYGEGEYHCDVWHKKLGGATGYLKGIFVAALALRRFHPEVDRVVLVEASTVPKAVRRTLRRTGLFKAVKAVEHLWFDWQIWSERGSMRHSGVFGKVHAMDLVQYDRVVVLDADILPVGELSGLLDPEKLPLDCLPAAMRMPGAPAWARQGPNHGDWIWVGHEDIRINAGVLVMQPRAGERKLIADEIAFPKRDLEWGGITIFGKPFRPTTCPEEEVLSRYWSRVGVTHLGVEFNFETVPLGPQSPYFELHDFWEQRQALNLEVNGGSVRLLHFVCRWAKPWALIKCSNDAHGDCLRRYLEMCSSGDNFAPGQLGVFHYAAMLWLAEWSKAAETEEWQQMSKTLKRVERRLDGGLCCACMYVPTVIDVAKDEQKGTLSEASTCSAVPRSDTST